MSADTASLAEHLDATVVDILWRQWACLRGEARLAGAPPARAMIDPDALVLASLATRAREARLRDVLAWWIPRGGHLVSVQRLKTLRRLFADVDAGVEWYADRCVQAGDARWRSLQTAQPVDEPAREGKGPTALGLIDPGTCWLRLRAGFGVGAKADLLAFLIGGSAAHSGQPLWTSAPVLAEATSYSRSSVRRALDDMCLARFVEASADRPTLYATDARAWKRALHLDDDETLPRWGFWGHTFALLMRAAEWARRASDPDASPTVHASLARDLHDEFEPLAHWHGCKRIDPREHPGTRYGTAFVVWIQGVADHVTDAC